MKKWIFALAVLPFFAVTNVNAQNVSGNLNTTENAQNVAEDLNTTEQDAENVERVTEDVEVIMITSDNAEDVARKMKERRDRIQKEEDEMFEDHLNSFFQEKFLQENDVNRDGVVSKQEYIEVTRAKADAYFTEMDVNEDGLLTEAEVIEARNKMIKRREEGKKPKTHADVVTQ